MTRKACIGSLAIIIGGVLLSVEMYSLKFIQRIELNSTGTCYSNAFNYVSDGPILVSVIIALCIVIYGVVLLVSGSMNFKPEHNGEKQKIEKQHRGLYQN